MDNLMDTVSFVFQDAFMLDDTIYKNISIGKKLRMLQKQHRFILLFNRFLMGTTLTLVLPGLNCLEEKSNVFALPEQF